MYFSRGFNIFWPLNVKVDKDIGPSIVSNTLEKRRGLAFTDHTRHTTLGHSGYTHTGLIEHNFSSGLYLHSFPLQDAEAREVPGVRVHHLSSGPRDNRLAVRQTAGDKTKHQLHHLGLVLAKVTIPGGMGWGGGYSVMLV